MAFSILIAGLLTYILYRIFTLPKPLPGPKPFPLLGNLTSFPPANTPEHIHWAAHRHLYGEISSVSILGMTLVLLNTKQTAHELLDQHSAKTSGRPAMTMANTLCGYERIVLCQGYTHVFRRCRKFLHRELGSRDAAAGFRAAQEVEVKRLLVRALNSPEKWASGATVLKMAYGYTVEPHKPDPLVRVIDQMMTEFSQASVPMAWAVDIIPSLRYLPEWFPGTGFHATARKWRKSIEDSAYIPYRFVQRQMHLSNYKESFVSRLITQLETENGGTLDQEDEQAVIWTAASLYGAAADTTVISLTAFTAAMIMFPEVQDAAQKEIDRVIGSGRLPGFNDRGSLPYINALVKELLRWWPIAPMGFPHTATEDIEYNGMHIPKGAIFLPSVWSILHDPEIYPDPDRFDPTRFFNRNEPDPETELWGYGRRICAGRHFAEAGVYLNIVQSLAVFTFKKAVRDGKEVDVCIQPKPGVLAYPTGFEFRVVPRSERHEGLIKAVERECPFEESDAGLLVDGSLLYA
ncbi:cytochrome P450 [Aspergillus unguis]